MTWKIIVEIKIIILSFRFFFREKCSFYLILFACHHYLHNISPNQRPWQYIPEWCYNMDLIHQTNKFHFWCLSPTCTTFYIIFIKLCHIVQCSWTYMYGLYGFHIQGCVNVVALSYYTNWCSNYSSSYMIKLLWKGKAIKKNILMTFNEITQFF